jgi:hypothetical protein
MKLILAQYNSSKIFLLDASGAFVSIILLSVLYIFEEYFGMPQKILSIFIGIASVFCLYSVIIYLINPIRWRTYLKIIAILNICYCLLTIFHVFLYFENLTLYGNLYFVGEVLVIILLAIFELKMGVSQNYASQS